ncbi:IPT/TIG domain-containing protein [Streptomyces sp. NPDC058665]|uniref:IPT/TIG domain-containing protein n=1 Tax=Streptomyces sp. NPDC058665 TaxID=3346586 RepID=UPI00365F9172
MPVISSVTPNQGASGTTVTITGTGFTTVTEVTFGGRPVPFTIVNSTTIVAIVPTLCCGQSEVRVAAGPAWSNGVPFFYICPPKCREVRPDSGPAAGGTTVTIYGSGLATATSVAFGPNAATPTVVSDSQLTVTSPALSFVNCTETVDVVITTAGGTSCAECGCCRFTYFNAPTVTSITPDSGSGCTTITLTGTCLLNVSEVTFSGTPAAFTSISSTVLTATVPSGLAPGTYAVVVVTPGGSTAPVTFTVL